MRRESQVAPSAASLHALALAELLYLDSSGTRLDLAIQMLEDARALPGAGPGVAADLSAAYLVRSESRGEASALMDAAEAALDALAADSALLHARFNLALSLSRMSLPLQATLEWRALEASPVHSRWRPEIRRHLITDSLRAVGAHAEALPNRESVSGAAERADSPRDAQSTRLYGFDTLLVAWGRLHRAGRLVEARAALARADTLGKMLRSRDLDRSLDQVVREVTARADAHSVDLLADGLAAYGDALASYARADFAAAASGFQVVVDRAGPRSALSLWAHAHRAACVVQGGDPAGGERQLRALLVGIDGRRYPALVGRIEWARAIAAYRDGRSADALDRITAMQSAFERASEPEHVAIGAHLRANYLLGMGNAFASVTAGLPALERLSRNRRSTWLQALLEVLAEGIARRGAPRLALRVQRESAGVSRGLARDLYLAPAMLALARREADAGNRLAALRAIDAGEAAIGRLPAGVGREWQLADARIARAGLDSTITVPQRQEMLRSGIDFFARIHNLARLAPAYVALANLELGGGQRVAAESALVEAVRTIERYAKEMRTLDQRAVLATSVRQVFDQLAMLRLHRADTLGALEWVERGRVALAVRASAVPVSIARPDRRELVLDLTLVGDTLLQWLVSDDRTRLVRQQVRRGDLQRLLSRVRTELELGAPLERLRPDLEVLYTLLVRPVASIARPEHRLLTIVADGELAEIPVAVAVNGKGEFAVERFAVRYLETLRDVRNPDSQSDQSARAVLVAEPKLDASRFPRLGALPNATLEVNAIRRHYAGAVAYVGGAATVEAIQRALTTANVFHFAGHTVFDGSSPDRSFLALTRSDRDVTAEDGVLDGRDVRSLDLRRMRLVVLSSCESARGGAGHAGALAGLSGAFRIAGAQGVVGSLWRVQDDVTTRLMMELHQRYARGVSAPDALHEAQLALLRSGDSTLQHPASWAGFRYAGY